MITKHQQYKYSIEYRQVDKKQRKGQLIFGDNAPDNMEIMSSFDALNKKKGQAAMEFLMTYGWAILAALIAIGVLVYFKVFT